MRLGTAIERLVENYNYAVGKEWIQDKVAWALYHTWKEADERRAEQTEPSAEEFQDWKDKMWAEAVQTEPQNDDEFKLFDREALILLIECQKERIAELLAKTEPSNSEIPNNCEELNAYRKCVESRSFWDHKHCDGCYFDERCPFDEPKDEQNLSEKPTGSEPQTEVSAQEYERWLFKEPQTERSE